MRYENSRSISFHDSNTASTMKVLIPFNCIIDTDFGLLTYIRNNFFDTTVFNKEFFEKKANKVYKLVNELYDRFERNPLSICINNTNDMESYYNEFFEKKYREILDSSIDTEIVNLINLFTFTGKDIVPTIVYEHEVEKEFISKIDFDSEIDIKHVSEIDPNNYDHFLFKYVDGDTYTKEYLEKLKHKTIYFAAYRFNVDAEKQSLKENYNTAMLYINKNHICIIDLYDKSKLKEAMQNNGSN